VNPSKRQLLTHLAMTKEAKTPEQVRAEFVEAGISVSEWARTNKFKRMTVVDVLRGHRKGLRGEAHKVAVALGLKEGSVIEVAKFKPLKRAA
jgi:gp16 family phage-associated protein